MNTVDRIQQLEKERDEARRAAIEIAKDFHNAMWLAKSSISDYCENWAWFKENWSKYETVE